MVSGEQIPKKREILAIGKGLEPYIKVSKQVDKQTNCIDKITSTLS